MIKLEKYNKAWNPLLKSWLSARDQDTGTDELPEIGYLAMCDNLPVAAGFVRRCEGGYGILDSFVTNPDAPSEIRNEALDLLASRLIEVAKNSNIKKLLASSLDKNTIERSIRFGFKALPHTLLGLKIE